MARPRSKRLVIDASLAGAAGGKKATHPTSKLCRDFLLAVLKICHQIVMTPEVRSEWKKNQSLFAQKWLASMTARKKVHKCPCSENADLRKQIKNQAATKKQAQAMLKDCHLLEAALETDKLIISLDETARQLFHGVGKHVGQLRSVVWVNPGKPDEAAQDWINRGAKSEKDRCLGLSKEKK